MPLYLTQQQIYRMLQRELPEDVYPDGSPNSSYSTADMDSIAAVAASGYENLSRIYDNYWPQTADEKIADWEIMVYGQTLDNNLTLEERRDRVIQKLRTRKGITRSDILETIYSVIGSDKTVELNVWGCSRNENGAWVLGEDLLGVGTILGNYNQYRARGEHLCSADPADFGLTEEEWLGMRREAYTYEVKIIGYALTMVERKALDEALSAAEPARSAHVINDDLTASSGYWFGWFGDPDALGFGDLNDESVGGYFKSLFDE